MFTKIKILVYAKSKVAATDEAQRVATLLTDNLIFDHVEANAGYRADSKKGRALIACGLIRNEEAFRENLKRVRSMLTRNSDDTLYANEHDTPNDIRHWGSRLGSERQIFLFGDDGEAIRTPTHLQDVLAKWPGHDKVKEGDVWVFEAHTHY